VLTDDDRGYWLARAREEREFAAEATDPSAAKIHQQLADEYAEKALDGRVGLRWANEDGPTVH
jgi:hypothetical protein